MFCSILVFQVRDMLSSRVIEDIYAVVVGDVGGCRWLLNFLRWL